MQSTLKLRFSRRVAMLATALAVGAAALIVTESSLAGPARGCAYDRPCIDDAYYTKSRTVFLSWTATESFSHYNVIWWRPGKARRQVEVPGGRSGSFRVRNVRSWTTYDFAVQGCNTRILAPSKCSPWEPARVHVRAFTS